MIFIIKKSVAKDRKTKCKTLTKSQTFEKIEFKNLKKKIKK